MTISRKAVWILAVLAGIGFAALVIVSQKKAAETRGAYEAGEKYYCPMHPQVISDKPGNCPICHMRLVRAGSGEVMEEKKAPESEPAPHDHELMKEGYVPVRINSQKRQLIGLKTSAVERKDVQKVIRTVGRIAYDPELYQAEAEYIHSLKTLRDLPSEAPMEEKEWASRLVESSLSKLLLLGLNQEMINEIGQMEAPDKRLLFAMAGGEAWVYANIYEYEIPLITVGDPLEAEVSSAPGEKLRGAIRAIDTVVDPMTRTVKVRALVGNEKGFLKPDMFVNVELKAALGSVLSIPEEAVFLTGRSSIVFVDKGEGLFEPRRVVLGQKAEETYEVKDGLQEEDLVVTNGNFLVDSESKLKAALSSMGEGETGPHAGHSHGS